MGHLHTDVTIRGGKAAVKLKNVLIATDATYMVLPEEILEFTRPKGMAYFFCCR